MPLPTDWEGGAKRRGNGRACWGMAGETVTTAAGALLEKAGQTPHRQAGSSDPHLNAARDSKFSSSDGARANA